jgi:hypothetical protein
MIQIRSEGKREIRSNGRLRWNFSYFVVGYQSKCRLVTFVTTILFLCLIKRRLPATDEERIQDLSVDGERIQSQSESEERNQVPKKISLKFRSQQQRGEDSGQSEDEERIQVNQTEVEERIQVNQKVRRGFRSIRQKMRRGFRSIRR